MLTTFSIADARRQLPSVIQRAESGEAIQISRHGTPVAVVISTVEYERLTQARPSLSDMLASWRKRAADAGVDELGEGLFDGIRDNTHRAVPDLSR